MPLRRNMARFLATLSVVSFLIAADNVYARNGGGGGGNGGDHKHNATNVVTTGTKAGSAGFTQGTASCTGPACNVKAPTGGYTTGTVCKGPACNVRAPSGLSIYDPTLGWGGHHGGGGGGHHGGCCGGASGCQ
jgi:hypothetical protein